MSTQPVWTAMPAIALAAGAGDFASILRIARTAAGLTLEEAGELAGYSASTLSRMETRPRRAWDVKELRRLAEVYGIPLTLFGLSTSTSERPALACLQLRTTVVKRCDDATCSRALPRSPPASPSCR